MRTVYQFLVQALMVEYTVQNVTSTGMCFQGYIIVSAQEVFENTSTVLKDKSK
jgi:hypothetical protein